MTKQVVGLWNPEDVADLREALDDILGMTYRDGGLANTINLNLREIALVRETLTDGSVVFNVAFRENG